MRTNVCRGVADSCLSLSPSVPTRRSWQAEGRQQHSQGSTKPCYLDFGCQYIGQCRSTSHPASVELFPESQDLILSVSVSTLFLPVTVPVDVIERCFGTNQSHQDFEVFAILFFAPVSNQFPLSFINRNCQTPVDLVSPLRFSCLSKWLPTAFCNGSPRFFLQGIACRVLRGHWEFPNALSPALYSARNGRSLLELRFFSV